VFQGGFEHREIPKSAGWRWDPAAKRWWTDNPEKAARLARYADDSCSEELSAVRAKQDAAVEASSAAAADVDLPRPAGLDYLPYQRAGIAAALARPNVLFGDEMGLGKTIQAIGVWNADETLRRVLVVCPASLRLNWKREWEKWAVRPVSIGLATSAGLPAEQVVIVNYDILRPLADAIREVEWDLLIADECHYLKNPDAQRTAALLGKWDRNPAKVIAPVRARRKLFLTGTPIPNRPIEGQTIFGALCPERFGHRYAYGKRYCNLVQTRYGSDWSGASNLPELQRSLRETILIRRLKSDVLTELPAKRRSVIEIPSNGAAGAVDAEEEGFRRLEEGLEELRLRVELAKASEDPADYEDAVFNLQRAAQAAFTEISRLRHATAVAKVPAVVARLQDALAEEGHKVVCFAHHRDVVAAIMEAFPGQAVQLTGETGMADRQAAVDRFQTDPECRLFVGSITAAGVGLTLTASSHVIFAELDWVPGNVTQAEDRCHRIGQHNSVLIEHLVFEGSLDARMAHILVQKQAVIEAALDKAGPVAWDQEPVLPVSKGSEAATEGVSRSRIAWESDILTCDERDLIHASLRALSSRCDGAHALDGAGFSKIDARIGKYLAWADQLTPKQAVLGLRLCRKYRGQLGDPLWIREIYARFEAERKENDETPPGGAPRPDRGRGRAKRRARAGVGPP
jgi:SWI/SNF-related matrix-associated actin-dependent regulator 1 of chromatin subfamily A